MWDLFRDRPWCCLKIGPQALAWGESSATWRGRRRYRCLLSPTPAGTVKLSPIDLNVTDRSVLEERLRALIGGPKRVTRIGRVLGSELRPITLLLADLSIRATVLHLEQFPASSEEQEALIRWRLNQDQRVPLSGAKVVWQVFPPAREGERSYSVFVVVIQEEILQQYESLCEAVGLIPRRVRVASLQLIELWLKTAGRRVMKEDVLWVNVADGGLTCLVWHRGRPQFVRMKLLGEDGSPDGERGYEQMSRRIVQETAASLIACREMYPEVDVKRVVLATDGGFSGLEEWLGNELGKSIERVDWDHVRSLGWTPLGGTASWAALPVVAGMV